MKVSLFSLCKFEESGTKWFHGGEDIEYHESFPKDAAANNGSDTTKSYYALTFSYTFEYSHDTVSFAFSQPYTYTDLQEDLSLLEESAKKHKL